MTMTKKDILSKVPEVTVFFWIIKVLCTTVGEMASDFLNINLGFGLMWTSVITGILLVVVLFLQFHSPHYTPWIYWLTVVLISVFGTLVTDNMTDGIGIPLEVSTVFFSVALIAVFAVWYLYEKTLSIHSVYTKRREAFYWLTILFTFALGTALGDLMAEGLGLGYLTTGFIVCGIILCVFVAWNLGLNSIVAFWTAYIMTRPLGASLGDFLSQPQKNGGLGLGATVTSFIFLAVILGIVFFLTFSKENVVRKEIKPIRKTVFNKKNVLIQTVVVVSLFIITGISGYSYQHAALASEAAASASGGISSKDMTGFISIEKELLVLVNNKDQPAAKAKATELETEWDNNAARLKAADKSGWSEADASVDQVLSEVRNSKFNAETSKSALNQSLTVLEKIN